MDDSSLAQRLKRYAQVSSMAGGLALKLAGERFLGFEIDSAEHAQSLKKALGNLKGPMMKMAQFLATIPGALPSEYGETFLELQTQAPPMSQNFVRRRMIGELGPQWRQHFSEFNMQPTAAASLGQVHQALGLDGMLMACKLQYPDMSSAIEADLQQLKVFLSLYESFSKALETTEVQQEIAQLLKEELDYTLEAKRLRIYGQIFANTSDIVIPQAIPSLSTARLLTMNWLEGKSLLTFADAPAQTRNHLAARLFWAWYHPFYSYGLIHGDPHPGNYTIGLDQQLNILDFGCTRIFPATFIQGVIDLYRALQQQDQALAVSAYERWGFKNLSKEVIEIITEWAKLLYGPLLEDRVRPIQEQLDGKVGWKTATAVHEKLRQLGGIKPPREFVFMDRAAVGVGALIMRLKAEGNWHRMFEEMIENFSENTVQTAQQKTLEG